MGDHHRESVKANDQTIITQGLQIDRGMLLSLKGPNAGREYVLVGPRVSIGRAQECDIILADLNVSREHAILRNCDGSYEIRDRQSKNGIYINGKRIRQKLLKDGDLVSIGESLFRFRFGHPNTTRSRSADFHMPLISQRGFRLPQFLRPSLKALAKQRLKGRNLPDLRRLTIYTALIVIALLMILPLLLPNGEQPNAAATSSLPTNDAAAVKVLTKKNTPIVRQASIQANQQSGAAPVIKKGTTSESQRQSLSRQKYSQAIQAMNAANYKAAIRGFSEVLQLQPGHEGATTKLAEAKKRLSDLIQQYYNTGLREFTNLYYDRAIHEWEKVVALSDGFEPEYQSKATEKIAEAQAKLLESR